MARMSLKSTVISIVVVLIIVLVFRGAGRWLMHAVMVMHGHGSPR